jgi:ABC-2 type transport system permease protein
MSASELGAALSAELLKIRRSGVPLITGLVVVVFPMTAALFVFIVADPQRAKDLGILGQKAQITGITPDWPGLLLFSTQAAAVALLMLFSFIVTWLFGREFVDRTAPGLMALPVSRAAVVAAKFLVFAVWALLLGAWLTALTFAAGMLMRLPGWSAALAADTALGMLTATLLTLIAIAPIAYVASRAKGYLAPLGSTIGLVAVAQVAAILGWGAYVPWAVPALAAGVAPDQSATPLSWLIVAATGMLGLWATLHWWRGPDAGL